MGLTLHLNRWKKKIASRKARTTTKKSKNTFSTLRLSSRTNGTHDFIHKNQTSYDKLPSTKEISSAAKTANKTNK